MTVLYILSSLGGAVAFFTVIWTILRSVARQIDAVKDNTRAVRSMTEQLTRLDRTVSDHDRDIAWLKGRVQ